MNIIIVVFTAKTWKKRTKSSLQKSAAREKICARDKLFIAFHKRLIVMNCPFLSAVRNEWTH